MFNQLRLNVLLSDMKGGRIRVLHVDDDPELAELTATYLTRENDRLRVDTETSAADGMSRLKETAYQCVISDYEMPGQDGLAFLREVRQTRPELPFILFTGRGSEAVASEAISAGVTDYLQKDSNKEQYELLANRITNAVEQRQAERRAKEERERFQTLFHELSQPIVEVEYDDEVPIINRVNGAFEDTFGYEATELIGNSLDAFVVPADREAEAKAINEHVRDAGVIESREVKRTAADGIRTFLLQNAVYEDGSGGFAIYTDITAQKEREDERVRSQALLRHTERLANVGGWEAAADAEHTRWTDGTYAIHEKPNETDSHPTVTESISFYNPDDQPVIKAAVEDCRAHGEPFELELRIQTEAGNKRWVSVHGEPVYDDDEIVRVRGAIHDVTAQKQREQELTRAEHLLEYAPELLVVTDEQLTVAYQSPPSPLGEWSPQDCTDDDALEHVHPTDKERVSDCLRQVIHQPNIVSTIEFRVRDQTGDWRWVEGRLQNFVETDAVGGVLVAMRDITARKRQEQELYQYTAFFRQLQSVTQTLLETTDIESAAAHVIESVESILEFDITGIWLHEDGREALEPIAVSERGRELIEDPPTYTPETESLSWAAYREQTVRYIDDVYDHENRLTEETPIKSEVIVPLGRHGVLNVGATETDSFTDVEVELITVWSDTLTLIIDRLTQLQLLQDREVELAAERDRLDEFTSIVSHDLRNPLNVAMGRVELAAEGCDSEHLDAGIAALRRMEELIADSLSLAQQGRMVGETSVVDLEAIASQCWQTSDAESATLIVEATGLIRADPSRLQQVFENLFANATTHGGASVTVTVGRTTEGFCIADDGDGLTPEQESTVFEPGYTTDGDGIGYGLAIVKQVCEAHGWAISVSESEAGGARFDVTGVEFVEE